MNSSHNNSTFRRIMDILCCCCPNNSKEDGETDALTSSSAKVPINGTGQCKQTLQDVMSATDIFPESIESIQPRTYRFSSLATDSLGYYTPSGGTPSYGKRESLSDDTNSLSFPNNGTASCSPRTSVDSASMLSSLGVIPDLYQRRGTVVRRESEAFAQKAGKVHFKLLYNFKTSDLIVELLEAQQISNPGASLLATMDPFIRVNLEPPVDPKQRQTAVQRATKSPTFNETFKFPVAYEDLGQRTLLLSIMDYNTNQSAGDVVGEVRVKMDSVDVSTELEVWNDVTPVMGKSCTHAGEILISLNYLPAAERLSVTIMKAKELKTVSTVDSLELFAKVALMINGKRSKKKRTSVQKRTLSPVWNEAITFDISKDILDNVMIEVSIIASPDLLIGKIELGDLVSQNTCRKQFIEMRRASMSTIHNSFHAIWHTINK